MRLLLASLLLAAAYAADPTIDLRKGRIAVLP
jgi:hypothetical protein